MAYTFDGFAGQLVAGGTATNPDSPAIGFEDTASATTIANMNTIKGLLPKLAKTLIHETRIRGNPLERMFRKGSLPYGIGMEQAAFEDGVVNKKKDGTCIPSGDQDLVSQIDLINFAWDLQVRIKDREINHAVLGPEEVGAYITAKMRLPEKTRASMKYLAQKQLLSDVIDGTRTISSTTISDGTGTQVTYSPNITGYCASSALIDSGVTLNAVVQGTVPSISVADTVTILEQLRNAVTEMKAESTAYSKLGINTLILEAPYLVMEEKVLNAMDSAIMSGASQRIPTRTAREYVRTFADLVEIPDGFAALPTNTSYSNKRLAAVLLDKDSATEQIVYEAAESGRCHNEFATGFIYAGESLMSIWRGGPAAALLTDTSS